MPAARLIGVGVFVVGGLLIFALGLFYRRSSTSFADLFTVNAEFDSGRSITGCGWLGERHGGGEVTDIAFRSRRRAVSSCACVCERSSSLVAQTGRFDSTDGIVGGRYVQIDEEPSKPRPSPTAGRSRAANRRLRRPPGRGTKTIENVNVTINELRVHVDRVVGRRT